MASSYEPGLTRYTRQKKLEHDVIANPVGPPALVQPKTPSRGAPGPQFNPSATDLARSGSLRPRTGPFSPANPTPMTDGSGRLIAPSLSRSATPAPTRAAPTPATATPSRASGVAAVPGAVAAATPAATPATAPAATPAPVRPSFGQVAGGATVTGDGARSIGGRALGYGTNVGGVPTFTDADVPGMNAAFSRGPTGATLTRGPAPNDAAAQAGTLARTPDLGGVPALTRPAGSTVEDAIRNARAANVGARRDAASQTLQATTMDPRSVTGTTAWNQYVDNESATFRDRLREKRGGGRRLRRDGGGRDGDPATRALYGLAGAGLEPAARLGEAGVQAAQAREANQLQAQTELQRAALTRPAPQFDSVTLDDGTLAQIGPNGLSRPVIGPDGQPVRPATKADDTAGRRTAELSDAIAKSAGDLLQTIVPVGTAPTPDQVMQARTLAAQQHGLTIAQGEDGSMIVNINGEWVPL